MAPVSTLGCLWMELVMVQTLGIVAHRGASALAPENTLAAFRRARALGVLAIETDIRLSRDDGLILSHDEALTRLVGRPERTTDLDLAELRRIVVGTDAEEGPQRLATPAELFALADGRIRFLLDLKLPTAGLPTLLAAIREAKVEESVILGVRTLPTLAAIKAEAPGIATLAFGQMRADVWALVAAGAGIARLWQPWVEATALARAAALGTPVWVMCSGTAAATNGEATVAELLALRRAGIDAVILNDPRLALTANAQALD